MLNILGVTAAYLIIKRYFIRLFYALSNLIQIKVGRSSTLIILTMSLLFMPGLCSV